MKVKTAKHYYIHLTEGKNNIKKIYPRGCVVNGFAIGDFFDSFDI